MAKYIYIDRQHQLDLAIIHLQSTNSIAVDTESSGFYTYFSDLCLIQISSLQYHYIIDVQSNLNLDALGKIFADPRIEIIFHAASSDIIELKRAYDWDVNNVFDTLLACRMLTGDSCSLASVVEKIQGIKMEKKEQKSNWKLRPLTKSQLDYAHLDTLYLIDIRNQMQAKLKDLFLQEEFEAECSYMENIQKPVEKPFNKDSYIKINGVESASPEIRGRLKALVLLRDKVARKKNIASFRLISNDGLFRLASTNPSGIPELMQTKAGNPKFLQKEGERLLKAMLESDPITDDQLPQTEEMDMDIVRRLKKLKKTRQTIGNYRGMTPALVLSNRALNEMATNVPKDIKTLKEMDLMSPWKFKYYGELFFNTANGKAMAKIPETLPILPPEDRHK